MAVAVGAAGWFWLVDDAPKVTVQAGDTLWGIARDHGVSVEDLRRWNGLRGDGLDVGDVLRVGPGGASTGAAPSTGSQAPRPSQARKRPQRQTVQVPPGTPSAGSGALSLPAPEPCVPFDADPGEEGMVAPEGLSLAQARAALTPALQEALRCPPDPHVDQVDLVLALTVGCDGVVDRVEVLETGVGSARYARCVADVLGYADFPAHDLPDGDTITYPVSVSW